jgi:hypothetical protein
MHRDMIRKAAGLAATTVLILGVTGTGSAIAEEDYEYPDPSEHEACWWGDLRHDFEDVDESNIHEPHIACMSEVGVVEGYPDGTFRPTEIVQRGQLASMAYRALRFSHYAERPEPEHDFDDVDDTNVHHERIRAIATAGIMQGYGDGTFRPNDAVSRAEAATTISRLISHLHDDDATNASSPVGNHEGTFADVPEDNTHADGIRRLAEAGIALGVTDDRYAPHRAVRRDQIATLFDRAASYANVRTWDLHGDCLDEETGKFVACPRPELEP